MRAVVQRVASASVRVGDEEVARIGRGLLVLLGIGRSDDEIVAGRMASRLARLRIFPDQEGRFSHDVSAAGGQVLLVSQFTLLADTGRGNRPSLGAAADPPVAEALYERVAAGIRSCDLEVATGRFGAAMQVHLVNDGPVTIVLDL